MPLRIRIQRFAWLAGIAAAAIAGSSQAGPGGVPQLGNALNPAPINPSTAGAWMAEDGMGTREPAARSPSGKLYEIPLTPVDSQGLKVSESAWRSFGYVEFGVLGVHGDSQSQQFREYKDIREGPTIQSFGAHLENAESARYAEVVGGGVGRNDQFYGVRIGRYNDWKLDVYYDETPHVYTTTYRSLWVGAGTARLALAPGLAPGGGANAAATQAAVESALAVTESSELSVTRRKAGLRLEARLTEAWNAYASLSEDRRQGAQPFAAVFGTGTNLEVPQSVDTTTRDFAAGAQYRDAVNRVNLQATASFFVNNIDTLAFDNPLFANLSGTTGLTSNSFAYGRYDLAPSNEQYNVKGEYGRLFPDFYKANLTATAALGTMRQNDALIPPSPYALTGGTTQGVPLDNSWNTTAALTRTTGDARIDTRLAALSLSLKPADALSVQGRLRYYETINHTEYWACNPLTGQWGRLLNDGTAVSIAGANTMAGVNPPGTLTTAYNMSGCNVDAARALNLTAASGNIVIGSVPFDYRQTNAGVTADYRLGRTSSVNASLERENFLREQRERERTWEDKLKLGYVDSNLLDGMLRVSVEHDRRRGSEFNPYPYGAYLSSSFGPVPSTNGVDMRTWLLGVSQLQKFDVADRDQNVLNARVNQLFRPGFEGGVTLQWKDAQYPAEVGRSEQQQGSIALDFDYKAGPNLVMYGFYAYQAGRMEQRGVQSYACLMGQTYYFYSNGQVLAPATIGGPAPATPAGATLLSTQTVTSANWQSVCGAASSASPLFPDSRGWEVQSRDRNDTLGVGLRYDFGRAKLDANFTRTLTRTRIGYSYNPVALGMSAANEALAGDGFSDLTYSQNVLSLSLLVPIDKQMALRFFDRYESGGTDDWHYAGVAENPMPTSSSLYLDAGAQNRYSVNVIGILLQVKL
jgi:Putative outer membrane beta-barrel porin, MtrB/PioB